MNAKIVRGLCYRFVAEKRECAYDDLAVRDELFKSHAVVQIDVVGFARGSISGDIFSPFKVNVEYLHVVSTGCSEESGDRFPDLSRST
jgi:hypothetical protein